MLVHLFKLICVFVAFLSISFTTGFANGQSFPTSEDAVEAELPFWDYMQVAVLAEEGVSLEVIDDFGAARVSVFEHSVVPDFGYFAYLVPSANGNYLRLVEGDIVPWSDEIEFHFHTLDPYVLDAPEEISDDYTEQSTDGSRSFRVAASASGTTNEWVWWEGTKGFVAGLGQGVVNIGNGLTDSVIGIANIPATAVNAIAWTEEQVGILDPGDSIRVPYIPAPDWSRDLVVPEDDFSHDASKFIGASGVEFLSGVWVAKLAKADKAVDAAKAVTPRGLVDDAVQGSNPKFWKDWTNFRGNKVFQRDDLIDLALKDSRGRTNLERMGKGLAPLGPDGKSINLHHLIQTHDGAIAEVTQTMHQKYNKVLHINDNTVPSGIDRDAFNTWRRAYWKNRAAGFLE